MQTCPKCKFKRLWHQFTAHSEVCKNCENYARTYDGPSTRSKRLKSNVNREQLEADVEAFLANGGQITQVEGTPAEPSDYPALPACEREV